MSETGGITPAKWVARQGKNHLKDKDYLRTMVPTLPHLGGQLRRPPGLGGILCGTTP